MEFDVAGGLARVGCRDGHDGVAEAAGLDGQLVVGRQACLGDRVAGDGQGVDGRFPVRVLEIFVKLPFESLELFVRSVQEDVAQRQRQLRRVVGEDGQRECPAGLGAHADGVAVGAGFRLERVELQFDAGRRAEGRESGAVGLERDGQALLVVAADPDQGPFGKVGLDLPRSALLGKESDLSFREPSLLDHILECAVGVQHAAADHAALQVEEILVGALQHGAPEHLVGESGPAEVGDQQGGHARGVGRSHRGAGIEVVFVLGHAAEHPFLLGVVGIGSARGDEVDPFPVIGEAGDPAVRAVRGHGDDAVVDGRDAIAVAVVAGGEEDEAALHGADLVAVLVQTGVVGEVVDGRLGRGTAPQETFGPLARRVLRVVDIAPAAVGDHGAVVRRPDERSGVVAVVAVFLAEDVAGHQADAALAVVAARDAADADAVVVDGGDGAAHVGAVVVREQLLRFVAVHEVAASFFDRKHDAGQVLVRPVHAAVHDRDDHIPGSCGELLPDRLHVDVAAGLEV